MGGRLASTWDCTIGSDWVTAIDGPAQELLAVGTRDGHLALVDRYGTEVGGADYGSWIGAVRMVTDPPSTARPSRTFVWFGTKAGDIICGQVVTQDRGRFGIDVVNSWNARNTIRDIAVSSAPFGERTVAVGSEDRSVYLFSHDAVVTGATQDPREYRTGGWIRCVAFCRTPSGETVIAAGCGDKQLYFLNLHAELVGTIRVGAKIHSIAADEVSSRIYCTSDARKLDTVGWAAGELTVLHTEALQHRATRLIWRDNSTAVLLAICEDETVYEFTLKARRVTGHVTVGERVFSASVPDGSPPGTIMLGLADGQLRSCGYQVERGTPAQPASTHDGFLSGKTDLTLELLAEAMLYGPKTERVKVGIGRFLDIVPATTKQAAMCIVGTDEGIVVLIPLDQNEERRAMHQLSTFAPERVWAVRGRWLGEKHLALDVATSAGVVVHQRL